MVVDLVGHLLGNGRGGTGTAVVFDNWFAAGFLAGAEGLESRESLDALGAAEGLVGILVAVDSNDLGETFEVLGRFFVGWLEALAVTAPGCVELDNLAFNLLATKRFTAK